MTRVRRVSNVYIQRHWWRINVVLRHLELDDEFWVGHLWGGGGFFCFILLSLLFFWTNPIKGPGVISETTDCLGREKDRKRKRKRGERWTKNWYGHGLLRGKGQSGHSVFREKKNLIHPFFDGYNKVKNIRRRHRVDWSCEFGLKRTSVPRTSLTNKTIFICPVSSLFSLFPLTVICVQRVLFLWTWTQSTDP